MTGSLIETPHPRRSHDRRRSNTTSWAACANGWLVDHRRTDYPFSGNLQPRGQLKTALTKPPFSWIDHLIRPSQQRRPHRPTYRRRGFFVLAFDVRLVAGFDDGGGIASYFLTSRTTSCHQCSAGPFSNPSSRRRVSENVWS